MKKKIIKLLKILGAVLLTLLFAFAALVIFLSVTEYKPEDTEILAIDNSDEASLVMRPGESFSMLSWNIGYGALGDDADFFMDGGRSVKTADNDRVLSNMHGMLSEIENLSPDILLIQEVDRDSARSYGINEYEMLADDLQSYSSSFASNFKVAFIPYPLPPIGRVDSGIATYTQCSIDSAVRVQLPIPFKWPVSIANLKRCLLITRIPVEGSVKEFVLINLHLEAYDSGEGKIAQANMLATLLEDEARSGNYVVAAGDFNQIFSTVDSSRFPLKENTWQPGIIDTSAISGEWQFLMDDKLPSCRSLDRIYAGADKSDFQYYQLDGYIVSSNIYVEDFKAIDLDFVCSDHNPVYARLKLGQ